MENCNSTLQINLITESLQDAFVAGKKLSSEARANLRGLLGLAKIDPEKYPWVKPNRLMLMILLSRGDKNVRINDKISHEFPLEVLRECKKTDF